MKKQSDIQLELNGIYQYTDEEVILLEWAAGRINLIGTSFRDVQLVRAEEEHFLEGIVILAQLELMEKLIEETLEEAFEDIFESGGSFGGILNNLIARLELS